MIEVRLHTRTWTPRSGHQVTVRCSATGWMVDEPGFYSGGSWRFKLPAPPLLFKFLLDGRVWMTGADVDPQIADGDARDWTEAEVNFPPDRELVVEASSVQRKFFPPRLDDDHVFDVIVVGAGLGGGVLADELADLGKDVLVLEAGSYLFPTHVANLPRQHQVGVFSKHVWGLYDEFRVVNYDLAPGSRYEGGQAFNLGGRSVFWGGLIPRLGAWELATWPAAVRDHLLTSGFAAAEDLLNSTRPASAAQDRLLDLLKAVLPDHSHRDAPTATQYQGSTPLAIPAGMFSTADLLLESVLTVDPVQPRRPNINLNHAVHRLEADGERITAVHCHDLIADVQRTFRANVVVLAAGTVESTKIALLSGLKNPGGLIGKGITDHPVWYTHFGLRPNSPFAGDTSAKTWSRPDNAGTAGGQYNLVVELGADFNQNRFVDDTTLQRHLAAKNQIGLGELVVLFNSPLVETNSVQHAGGPASRPTIAMDRAPTPPEALAQARDAADRLLKSLNAVALPGETLDLVQAPLGAVAHEVGTLRMGENNGVVDADLKFRGYENLYVCDMSVLPTSPAGNPSLTLVALAQRLAKHL